MLLLWGWLLAAAALAAGKDLPRLEDGSAAALNTTTLYPVANRTDDGNRIKSATSWKIETTFGESQLKAEDSNGTSSKEQPVVSANQSSEETGDHGSREGGQSNSSKEFRPSPQLGSFEDSEPARETFGGFTAFKKPSSSFFGSHKEPKNPFHKFPKEVLKHYQPFPYKLESPILTRVKDDWRPSDNSIGLDAKPTLETPVRVPAGSLYKAQDPFKDKPDEDFGLDFSTELKDVTVKKRGNPWQKLLYLVTSLIPVGLIFSALTPSVISIQPSGSEGQYLNQQSAQLFRRGDFPPTTPLSAPPLPRPAQPLPAPPAPAHAPLAQTSQLLSISERCRRRLLCELRNDALYARSSDRPPRLCHRIPCEDPSALASTLNFLLSYQQAASAAFQQQLMANNIRGSGDTLNVIDHFT